MGSDFKDLYGDWEPKEDRPRPDDDPLAGEPENRTPRTLQEKEVKVLGVFEHADTSVTGAPQTFILFQDNRGRKVPIFIGRFEALAISMALEGEEIDRPMTYDLIRILIERLGATVDRVIVDDLWSDVFYAKLCLTRDGEPIDIDCRPSDAVNIALRFHAPIYMAESVIESIEQKF